MEFKSYKEKGLYCYIRLQPPSAAFETNESLHRFGQYLLWAKTLSTGKYPLVIGHRVGDIIGEAVTAMAFRAAAEDIARLSHAHPTFYESAIEASLAVDNRAIYS